MRDEPVLGLPVAGIGGGPQFSDRFAVAPFGQQGDVPVARDDPA